MNILVVNDDGYEAEGIHILAEAMKQYGNVYVMSPNTQQSGASHCITVHTFVRIHEQNNFGEGIKAWSIEGTPADCVIFATKYMGLDIDLVVSGINDGPNLGTDTIYSGTLAGATEAHIMNIPAVAFSADFHNFETVKKEIDELVEVIMNEKLYSSDYVLNVNLPAKSFEKSKGIKLTEQGIRRFRQEFIVEDDKIWARGTWDDSDNEDNTDVHAFMNGYISLTPMDINRFHSRGMKRLKEQLG